MPETKHLKTKIALVGDKAVGKTSLIRRFVLDEFGDEYLLTLGTKVSKKVVEVPFPDRDLVVSLEMSIWDIMGQTAFRDLLKESYFYGARGILAVVDFTRRETLDGLGAWVESVEDVAGDVPAVLAVNKKDLRTQWAFREAEVLDAGIELGCDYFLTSAKTGENVDDAFRRLASHVAAEHLRAPSRALGAQPS